MNPIKEAFTTAFAELFTPTINGILAQRAASGLTPGNWTQLSAAINRNRGHLTRAKKAAIPSVDMLYTFASALQVEADVLLPKLKHLLPIATRSLVSEYGISAGISQKESEIYAFYLLIECPESDLDSATIRAAADSAAPTSFNDAKQAILTTAEAVGGVLRKHVAITLLENPVSIVGGDHGRFK
ncbi:hypothetical protein [Gemmata sp. SH-PL17]|uniref:hypothetical protein n=1 Tax=Gemmata sp. SH-PL17 TaxID=1630693 RepID=UPI0009EDF38D|nr:hypothetical protein [Gemmata sp. SH-PL17]